MEWDNVAFDVSSQEFLNVIKCIIPKKPVQKKKYLIEYPKRLSIGSKLPKTKALRSRKISISIEKQHAKVQLPILTHKINTPTPKIRESQSLKIKKGSKILTNCKLQAIQAKEDRISVQVIKAEEKEEIKELSTEKNVEYKIEKMNIGVKRRRKTKDSQPKESLQSLLARTKIHDDVIIKRNNNFDKEPQTVRISSLQQKMPQPEHQQANPQKKVPNHKKINPQKPSRSLNSQKQSSSPPKQKQHPSIQSILQMVKQEEQKRRKRREQAEADAAKKQRKQKAEEEEEEEEEEGPGDQQEDNKNMDIDQPVKNQVIPEEIQEQYNSNVCGNMSKMENSSIQEYVQEEKCL